MVKNLHAMLETPVQSLGQEDPLRREWQPTLVFLPGEFHGQIAWQATVHVVAKSQTQLSNFHSLTHSTFMGTLSNLFFTAT